MQAAEKKKTYTYKNPRAVSCDTALLWENAKLLLQVDT
jgi:hypothetical protein